MAYTKTNWIEGGAPAINAENLNKIEKGLEDAHSYKPKSFIRATKTDEVGIPAGTDTKLRWTGGASIDRNAEWVKFSSTGSAEDYGFVPKRDADYLINVYLYFTTTDEPTADWHIRIYEDDTLKFAKLVGWENTRMANVLFIANCLAGKKYTVNVLQYSGGVSKIIQGGQLEIMEISPV